MFGTACSYMHQKQSQSRLVPQMRGNPQGYQYYPIPTYPPQQYPWYQHRMYHLFGAPNEHPNGGTYSRSVYAPGEPYHLYDAPFCPHCPHCVSENNEITEEESEKSTLQATINAVDNYNRFDRDLAGYGDSSTTEDNENPLTGAHSLTGYYGYEIPNRRQYLYLQRKYGRRQPSASSSPAPKALVYEGHTSNLRRSDDHNDPNGQSDGDTGDAVVTSVNGEVPNPGDVGSGWGDSSAYEPTKSKKSSTRTGKWTPELEDLLLQLRAKRSNWTQIAAQLSAASGRTITKGNASGKLAQIMRKRDQLHS